MAADHATAAATNQIWVGIFWDTSSVFELVLSMLGREGSEHGGWS